MTRSGLTKRVVDVLKVWEEEEEDAVEASGRPRGDSCETSREAASVGRDVVNAMANLLVHRPANGSTENSFIVVQCQIVQETASQAAPETLPSNCQLWNRERDGGMIRYDMV